ncbi:MAG TPA: hypothetical protein IGS53_23555 [Leptolyngbyaceae cyanobacterium M33_DOE_097]|uniref:Uncharacterized protein n=1 Tax=Oscillatoriales cyanobacterium SpSt-418 TaxID=2282169 RepID=A0A7C3KBI5_9CYAN|nr:hypothetical protein [Leptolyngbyaceae cyanobacterium M33_DOE_097]
MAKRRNLKKEKALRNQAYARKFRKKSSSGRFGKRRYDGGNRSGEGDMDQEGAATENEGASD